MAPRSHNEHRWTGCSGIRPHAQQTVRARAATVTATIHRYSRLSRTAENRAFRELAGAAGALARFPRPSKSAGLSFADGAIRCCSVAMDWYGPSRACWQLATSLFRFDAVPGTSADAEPAHSMRLDPLLAFANKPSFDRSKRPHESCSPFIALAWQGH